MTAVFIMALLCVLPGCETDDTSNPQSKTFVDNVTSPAKEFTIDENFGFKVKFFDPDETAQGMTIKKNDVITGKITEAFKPDANGAPTSALAKWNEDIVGSASQMASSTNSELDMMLKTLFANDSIGISMTYSEAGVNVQFPGGGLAGAATPLMGGIYYTKK